MPRKRIEVKIIKTEEWEDEEYTYKKCYFNTGSTATNRHPKHPKVSKEEIFKQLGPMLMDLYDKALYNRQQRLLQEQELKRG